MDERIYRFLLGLYPKEHRDAYGEPMVQGFRDLRREAARRGSWALLPFWARIYSDTVASVWRERVNRPIQVGWTAKLIGFGLFVFMLLNVHELAEQIFIILNRDADGGFYFGRHNALYWSKSLLDWHPAFSEGLRLAGLVFVYAAIHTRLSATARLGFMGLSLAVAVRMLERLFGVLLLPMWGDANVLIYWLGLIALGATALWRFRISMLAFGRLVVGVSGTLALVRTQFLAAPLESASAVEWIIFDVEIAAFYVGWILIAAAAHQLMTPKRSALTPARIERWTGD